MRNSSAAKINLLLFTELARAATLWPARPAPRVQGARQSTEIDLPSLQL